MIEYWIAVFAAMIMGWFLGYAACLKRHAPPPPPRSHNP